MKRLIFLFSILRFSAFFSQDKIEVPEKTLHFVYIVPTSMCGSTWADIDALWCEIGYGHVAKRHGFFYDVKALYKSYPSNGSSILRDGISQVHSTGLSTSFEYKQLLTRRFYIGAQFYAQTTKTARKETYLQEGANSETTSQYLVKRNEFGILPKFGILFVTKGDMSCDIGLGCGLRYISSKSDGKKNPEGNNEKEYLTNKVFDHGQKFAQRISLQFRVGYAF